MSNDAEWRNPANWSGGLMIYRSPRDTRLIVPKKQRLLGWTVNFAHPRIGLFWAGVLAFIALDAWIVLRWGA